MAMTAIAAMAAMTAMAAVARTVTTARYVSLPSWFGFWHKERVLKRFSNRESQRVLLGGVAACPFRGCLAMLNYSASMQGAAGMRRSSSSPPGMAVPGVYPPMLYRPLYLDLDPQRPSSRHARRIRY